MDSGCKDKFFSKSPIEYSIWSVKMVFLNWHLPILNHIAYRCHTAYSLHHNSEFGDIKMCYF